ncbi:hypothetical protein FRB97_003370 [Tulasnella sp. 331]|nr:hypothetical protein FRB97_003370 [Tulasnella sp. 331]KAG8867774.1 hypothetical protein FRB98_003966 [Tulasnella sp. 332]
MDHPTQTAGPEVNGRPSIILLLTPKELTQYPYLTSLRSLANAAFASNHTGPTDKHLFPSDPPRLVTDHQLQTELGSDFFTYIIHSSIPVNGDPPQLYASGSGRPYMLKEVKEGVPKDMALLIPTKPPDSKIYEAWEIKMLVVDPALQKQGLASLLLKLVEAEIVKRSAEKWVQVATTEYNQLSSAPNRQVGSLKNELARTKKVILTLDTAREINEAYYLRRGFETTEVLPMKKGVFGARRDWEMSFMQRDIIM